MSHILPQEILDLIIDDLHDEPAALKACCLVSSAWVHRTRNHLFARIEFNTFTCPIGRWRETFPDPTNSPAHNARALSIRFPKCITASNVDLFRTFRNVICLNVESDSMIRHEATLVPLHGFSTVLRSLRLVSTFFADSEVFDLVCSLPLLEDLALVFRTPWRPQEWTRPRTSPRLTGSLELYVEGGFQSITDHLLRFPNGLHFRRLAVWLVTSQNIKPVEDLMSRCSDTLESLSITSLLPGVPHLVSVPNRNLNFDRSVALNQPLQSSKAPGCRVSVRRTLCPVDRYRPPLRWVQEHPSGLDRLF